MSDAGARTLTLLEGGGRRTRKGDLGLAQWGRMRNDDGVRGAKEKQRRRRQGKVEQQRRERRPMQARAR